MSSSASLRALCAVAVLAAPCALARAQPAPTPAPSPTPALAQIAHVVTSDRGDEKITSSARTTYVITKAEILRYGYRTVGDAIATLPGVSLMRYGPGAAASTLSIRGSSPAEVLVLIDGVPAGGAQIADSDVAAIPTDGVQRIEVVEGGGSTLYGSGSMGGIVNIITAPARGSVADATIGSFGERDLRVQTPYVSFERAVANDDFSLPGGGDRFNADYGLWNARAAYDEKLGAIDAQFGAGLTDRHQGVPGSDTYLESPTSRQNDVARDAHITLSTTRRATTATLQLAATSQALAFTCDGTVDPACVNVPYPVPSAPPYAPPYAELLTESRVQASLRFDADHPYSRTVYGLDFSRGTADVDDGIDPSQIHGFAQSAAYVQQSWNAANGDTVYAGVRGERDGWQGGAFSPSIGGIVRLSQSLALHANAATAFRAPTVEDLYYPYYSNPNLVPERTRVGDLTLNDDALLGGVSFAWFTTAGDNLIVSNAPAYIPENVGRASIQGFTLSARTQPSYGIYTKLAMTDLYRAQDLASDTRLPDRGPVLQANVELGYLGERDGIVDSAAITVRNEGARGYVDPTQPLFDQPISYSDIGAFVRLRAGKRALVTLRGFNLGDERYAEFAGYPMPGRSFELEVSSR